MSDKIVLIVSGDCNVEASPNVEVITTQPAPLVMPVAPKRIETIASVKKAAETIAIAKKAAEIAKMGKIKEK